MDRPTQQQIDAAMADAERRVAIEGTIAIVPAKSGETQNVLRLGDHLPYYRRLLGGATLGVAPEHPKMPGTIRHIDLRAVAGLPDDARVHILLTPGKPTP